MTAPTRLAFGRPRKKGIHIGRTNWQQIFPKGLTHKLDGETGVGRIAKERSNIELYRYTRYTKCVLHRYLLINCRSSTIFVVETGEP